LVFNLSANGTTYKLPATLSIPNATYSRTSDTAGTLTFSGVSADQSFSVVAEEIQTGYTVQVNNSADCFLWDGDSDSGIPYNNGEMYQSGDRPTVIVTSGKLFVRTTFGMYGISVTGGVSVYHFDDYTDLTLNVSGNGSVQFQAYD